MRTIEITQEVYSRLEQYAYRQYAYRLDSPSDVINRLLDRYENSKNLPNIPRAIAQNQEVAQDRGSRIFSNREIQQRLSSRAESLPEDELERLCNKEISKKEFKINHALFVKVSSTANHATKRAAVKSRDGSNRWTWKFEFMRNGFSYAICTQWGPKHDPYVQRWLNSHES